MCLYGTRASAPTEPSVAPTSFLMLSRTPILVRPVKFCSSITGRSHDPGPGSQRTTRGSTEPGNPTVRHVPSKPDAVPGSCAARCREACMRLRARLSGVSPARPNISSHAANGRRSRCYSRISSESSGSIAFGYAAHWAPRTSSCSPQLHRTCVSWPSWPNHGQCAPPPPA